MKFSNVDFDFFLCMLSLFYYKLDIVYQIIVLEKKQKPNLWLNIRKQGIIYEIMK
jgi:hypothetical protein